MIDFVLGLLAGFLITILGIVLSVIAAIIIVGALSPKD